MNKLLVWLIILNIGIVSVMASPMMMKKSPMPMRLPLVQEKECKGDMNHDEATNVFDISGFVDFFRQHNQRDFWRADINDDGFVDEQDINPFIEILNGKQPVCR